MEMPNKHLQVPVNYGRAFAIGIGLNFAFVLIEAYFGWRVGSLALLADAAHNLSDVGGLVLAWAAYAAARLEPDARHTYGWRRGSILASFINASVLLVAMGSLAWEALGRMQSDAPIDAPIVMLVAGVGVLVNTVTAWLFARNMHDLNIRGAFLHMAADALVSLGVVCAGALYFWLEWSWIDPAVSLGIAMVVVIGTWSLFHRSLHLLFDGVPDDIDSEAVRRSLLQLDGVHDVHDLHVWAMSTAENALTAHLVADSAAVDRDVLLQSALRILHDTFALRHVALQIESRAVAGTCTLNGMC